MLHIHQITNFVFPQPFDGAVASRKPDGTVFEGNFKRGAPHGYFRCKASNSTPFSSFSDTSTPLETWSSLAVLCGESSTEFAGAPSPGEDFSSPPTTNSPGPWSPFSTLTAGDHLEKFCWTSGDGFSTAHVSKLVTHFYLL